MMDLLPAECLMLESLAWRPREQPIAPAAGESSRRLQYPSKNRVDFGCSSRTPVGSTSDGNCCRTNALRPEVARHQSVHDRATFAFDSRRLQISSLRFVDLSASRLGFERRPPDVVLGTTPICRSPFVRVDRFALLAAVSVRERLYQCIPIVSIHMNPRPMIGVSRTTQPKTYTNGAGEDFVTFDKRPPVESPSASGNQMQAQGKRHPNAIRAPSIKPSTLTPIVT
jgi:hypothetical protein